LKKCSRTFTYLPVITVFACRDYKFSVLDKVSKYHSLPLSTYDCTWDSIQIKKVDFVNENIWKIAALLSRKCLQ